MRFIRRAILIAVVALIIPENVRAIIGIGAHYGLDWSLSMEDVKGEQLVFDQLRLDSQAVAGTVPPGFGAYITGDILPIYITRVNFGRHPVNFGGKILVDALRFFEIEASTNFGLWEYEGWIKYPTGMTYSGQSPTPQSKPEDLFVVTYDSLKLTCKDLNVGFLGLDNTPYAKLHFDLTVKKAFLKIPRTLKTLSLYAGGGASVHFATPVLSAELIEDALGTKLETAYSSVTALGPNLLGNPRVMNAVVEKIVESLAVPKWGIHFVAGAQVKVPVVPLAFYVDGKLSIPFGTMDPYAELKGYGFLVNGGLMLKF